MKTIFKIFITLAICSCSEKTSSKQTGFNDNRIFTHDEWKSADKIPHKTNSSGYQMSFYNGNLTEEGQEVEGYKQGIWIEYYSDGKLKSIISYLDGVYDGVYKTYYHNGQLEEEGYHFMNKRPIYKDSVISDSTSLIIISNDKRYKQGTWKKYDSLGNIIETTKYLKGEVVK